jgi:AmmeMemoRadiSam system protein A
MSGPVQLRAAGSATSDEEVERGRPPGFNLSERQRADLLGVARVALARAVRGIPEDAIESDAAAGSGTVTGRLGGAFVTLLEDGELRGCIGTLDPSRPLVESVARAAIGAARRDWRFRPVTPDELPRIEIQVSVLGPLAELEEPTDFRIGVDGLIVQRGGARGLLLPEVATEHRLDERAMLEATCLKAGLPARAWRDPGTRVLAFRTERFGGPATG